MADQLQVELVSADRVVWSGEAKFQGDQPRTAGCSPIFG